MIHIRPEAHSGGKTSAAIEIERSDEHGSEVWLSVRDENETVVFLSLAPEEAHALSAALAHFADRAEGGR